jgi:hypothetical protein
MRQETPVNPEDICECSHKRSKHHAMVKDLAFNKVDWTACWVLNCACCMFKFPRPVSISYASRLKVEVLEDILQKMGSGFSAIGKVFDQCESNER